MRGIEKLGDIPDMKRYLGEDCYCPGEIYGIDGFFYDLFYADTPCDVIEESDGMVAVIASGALSENAPQAILFWRDDPERPGRIIAAQRVDATDNNVGILRSIVLGEKPDGRKIDEFNRGETEKALKKVMDLADVVIVD